VKKALGIVVLAVALLMPAQGVMAGEKEMKKTDETRQNLERAMKVKEKKEKMTPEQERETTRKFQDFNEYLEDLMSRAG
jgi:hypothetical protein